MRLRSSILLVVGAIVILSFGSLGAQNKPFKMTISGVSGFPLAMEVDGEEVPLDMGICGGTSNLGGGKYICTTSGHGVLEPAAENTRCPGGMEFVYTELEVSHIVRFYNNEVLAMVVKSEPDYYNNYFCMYFCDPATEFGCPVMGFYGVDYKTWEIIGGSGPYMGATGEASWEMRVDPVPYVGGENQWMVHPSQFNGYITLAGK